MKQYGRLWEVEISGENGSLKINKLRIAFEVHKTINEKPNPANLRIWNLNRDHINQLLSGEYKEIKLSVGYGVLSEIYKGDITKVKILRDGADFIMEIESGDGFEDYSKSRTNTTIKAGATDKEIVKQLSKTMSKTKLGASEFPNKRALTRGKVLHGDTRDYISRVAKNNNADWSIQNGELVFLPRDKVLDEQAVVLSQESGLISSPEQTDDGLELKCLLNPLIKIGGLVNVKSMQEYFDGEYKIVNLVHSGDAMSNDWQSHLTVVDGKFEKVKKDD